MDCAALGYPMDWPRILECVALSPQDLKTETVFRSVLDAISKVGVERLAPIKEIVGNDVSWQSVLSQRPNCACLRL
jgi:hypothetical protein